MVRSADDVAIEAGLEQVGRISEHSQYDLIRSETFTVFDLIYRQTKISSHGLDDRTAFNLVCGHFL